jgi:chloramphenicol 3-O-phosphotransferase
VNDKAAFSFATALRSLLRQDPDIMMVGEIRDGETAAARDAGRADRSPGLLHPAHERRARRDHATL